MSTGENAYDQEQEFVCKEWCWECQQYETECDNVFIATVWYNGGDPVNTDIECPKCQHSWIKY